MSARSRLYVAMTLLYALFFAWYTDLGGPMTDNEIRAVVAAMRTNGAPPDTVSRLERFMREDTGRQFLMVNNLDMNENPPPVAGAAPGESAGQLMARYMQHMFPALLARACHPVLAGEAVFEALDLTGIEGAEDWSSAAVMRYRSRRDMMAIVSDPVFGGEHHFKTAALAKTIAYPIETAFHPGDGRFLLALVLLAIAALLDALWLGRRR